ncbi:hypothetical protein BH11PAT1_BH11PAT1_4380 [soil metagenome]
MNQRGFSVLGILFLGCIIFSAFLYLLYLIFGALSNAYPINTGGWVVSKNNFLSYKHPKEWGVMEKNDETTATSLWRIPGISIMGEKVQGQLQYFPDTEHDSALCTEESKLYAQEFSYVYSKKDGMKCVFTDVKVDKVNTHGKTYIYNFHDTEQTKTITITISVPSYSITDPVLEKKLDTIVDSVTFK